MEIQNKGEYLKYYLMDNNVSRSTHTSRYIIPGRRAGNIQQIINLNKLCNNNGAACPSPINSKVINNSNPDVIPYSTQTQRAVNAIRYSIGGKIVYGNGSINNGITFLGKREGQPGGIIGPLRNKF